MRPVSGVERGSSRLVVGQALRRRGRALITAQVDAQALASLDGWDLRIDDRPTQSGHGLVFEELVGAAADCDVLVCEVDEVDDRLFAACPGLSVVLACRARPVNVDVGSATRRGVLVCNFPGRNADATADLTIGLLLSCARRICEAGRWLRAGSWATSDEARPYALFKGFELSGKLLGVVGAGDVGARVARRAAAFGMGVMVYDPYRAGEELEALGQVSPSLSEVLRLADVISLHVPLSEATRGLIGRAELASMQPTAVLVNVARGPIVDEEALVEALSTGRIAGAALDVFDHEPLPRDSVLLEAPNLVLTPHIGGATREVASRQTQLVARVLGELSVGVVPANALNLDGLAERAPRAGSSATIKETEVS